MLRSLNREKGIVWLLSLYVIFVWKETLDGDTRLQFEKSFGFLSFKFKMDSDSIGAIPGL